MTESQRLRSRGEEVRTIADDISPDRYATPMHREAALECRRRLS